MTKWWFLSLNMLALQTCEFLRCWSYCLQQGRNCRYLDIGDISFRQAPEWDISRENKGVEVISQNAMRWVRRKWWEPKCAEPLGNKGEQPYRTQLRFSWCSTGHPTKKSPSSHRTLSFFNAVQRRVKGLKMLKFQGNRVKQRTSGITRKSPKMELIVGVSRRQGRLRRHYRGLRSLTAVLRVSA